MYPLLVHCMAAPARRASGGTPSEGQLEVARGGWRVVALQPVHSRPGSFQTHLTLALGGEKNHGHPRALDALLLSSPASGRPAASATLEGFPSAPPAQFFFFPHGSALTGHWATAPALTLAAPGSVCSRRNSPLPLSLHPVDLFLLLPTSAHPITKGRL